MKVKIKEKDKTKSYLLESRGLVATKLNPLKDLH